MLLGLWSETREFQSHADARVTSTTHRTSRDFFLIDPEFDPQICGLWQRENRLNITTVPAHVRDLYPHRRTRRLVAYFHGHRNFMATEPATVGLCRRHV